MKSPLTSNAKTGFRDKNNRIINYLRLSVTDRCNLRCIYCMPEEGVKFTPRKDILTYEEMLRIVRLCVQRGIRKVRLTGGEPLVRKGFISFVERLCNTKGVEAITLTTNGVLLKDFARPLRECGICRVNVSMDTLRPDRFRRITRRDYFDRVWEGIEEAESMGFEPIKINVVAMRGVNDDEIIDFARLTYKRPYHIRFIEIMPVGEKRAWTLKEFMPVEEILSTIQSLGPIKPVHSEPLDGPAERYALEGAMGEIGFIGALSHPFCETCNRLRLTSEGRLKGCLFSDQETDIKTPLRQWKGDSRLLELITYTILNRPKNHGLDIRSPRTCVRPMNSIGG
jgi:GTP 3',8-cyclase